LYHQQAAIHSNWKGCTRCALCILYYGSMSIQWLEIYMIAVWVFETGTSHFGIIEIEKQKVRKGKERNGMEWNGVIKGHRQHFNISILLSY
jgi:hypothetical protein